jgi:hypothetical protein
MLARGVLRKPGGVEIRPPAQGQVKEASKKVGCGRHYGFLHGGQRTDPGQVDGPALGRLAGRLTAAIFLERLLLRGVRTPGAPSWRWPLLTQGLKYLFQVRKEVLVDALAPMRTK